MEGNTGCGVRVGVGVGRYTLKFDRQGRQTSSDKATKGFQEAGFQGDLLLHLPQSMSGNRCSQSPEQS